MRVAFFCVAKRKSPKKRRPRCLRPQRCALGQPVVLADRVRRRTHCAALQLRSDNCGELDHDACVSFGTHATPPAALLGAYRGAGERTSIRAIALLRCARPNLAGASASRCANWAERSNGPRGCSAIGCPAVPPLLAAPAAGRLRGEHGRRSARMHRCLARRSCLNEARSSAVSSAAHPATAPTQVAPYAQRRGRRLGVALSLVTFFRRRERKLLARRATPGLRPQHWHAAQSASSRAAPRFRQAQPERVASGL